jgi:hypothetical protein
LLEAGDLNPPYSPLGMKTAQPLAEKFVKKLNPLLVSYVTLLLTKQGKSKKLKGTHKE